MTTKAQRKQRRVAEQRGQKFALERAVLNAARALAGSVKKHGYMGIPVVMWSRFLKAEYALHEYHAAKARARVGGRADG